MLNKKLVATIIISSLTFTACTPTTEKPVKTEDEVVMENEVMGDEVVETIDAEETKYTTYNQETYESLLGKTPFALFFHAQWCPTCRKMEKDITTELSTFPEGTKILKVDFDTETELRKKYGITSQSTIVMIDASGQATKTLAAPSNQKLIEAITSNL